ncbi:hypothetical protein ABW20_dc0101659 [Dactylellina cionopaga]|nr:hypothetical protein ABW20_dc0101659 [Dactylellina cionopaga]
MMLELSAFKEQNPRHLDYADWPTFDLYDAIVWSPKSTHKSHLIDLLDVLEKGPFNVKGRFKSIPTEFKEYAYKPDLSNCEIQVANVRRWSIERCADEQIIIWALGNAAWWGIHPAPEYKEIYNVTLQKATIYNFILDKYGKISPKGAPLKTPMSQLYAEMTEETTLGNDSEKMVHVHRRFIIAQLLEEKNHPRYRKTPFWTYMTENHADEIAEIQATIEKVQIELEKQEGRKGERLSKSPPSKDSESPARPSTRTRSGTSSSTTSEVGTSGKRKSRDHSTDEPGSRRRKTGTDRSSEKPTSAVRLGQKSRRSNRIIRSTTPPILEIADSQERIVLSGRTTRAAKSSEPSPSSPTNSFFAPKSSSESTAPAPMLIDAKLPASKPTEAPPPPKPSVDTLREVLKVKTNSVPASRLSRLPGSRPTSKSTSPLGKKVTRAAVARISPARTSIATSPPGKSRGPKKAKKKKALTPAVPVVPLDENHPGYDDLRDQAISKLTQLHALYQKISKSESQAEYQKFIELDDENAEWRQQHGLKPVYIDVIYATGYYTAEIKDSSLIRRVPGTEYLIDTADWDFDTAVELLQNVNRGTYIHELLQPVKEARRNARLRGGKAGRGRPRKVAVTAASEGEEEEEKIETSMSGLKISSVPSGVSANAAGAAAAAETSWTCMGHDEEGTTCTFEIEDATSLEGAKKASDHWRTCPLRKYATEEALEKKKANIEQAQGVLRDQQVRDPWTNIE